MKNKNEIFDPDPEMAKKILYDIFMDELRSRREGQDGKIDFSKITKKDIKNTFDVCKNALKDTVF